MSNFVTPKPSLIFKRSKSIRDTVIHSTFINKKEVQGGIKGLIKCHKCKTCKWISEGKRFSLPNGWQHILKQNIACETQGVVYLLYCRCGAFYIGKTRRQLRQRLLDHLYDIEAGKLDKSLCRHVGFKHRYDPNVIACRVLEHIVEPPRGMEDGMQTPYNENVGRSSLSKQRSLQGWMRQCRFSLSSSAGFDCLFVFCFLAYAPRLLHVCVFMFICLLCFESST